MPPHFLIVDGFNLIRRIFEAGHSDDQDVSGTVASARASLGRALAKHQPTHAAVILENHDRTWRHLLYPDYKGNRSPTPQVLLDGLDAFRQGFAEIGVVATSVPNYEADDIIATLAIAVARHEGRVTILSTDKVFLQFLGPGVTVVDHFNGRSLDAEHVRQKFGVDVDRFVDYLALSGDRSNNIGGVQGIGPKTAVSLLEQYGSLDAMLSAPLDDSAHRKLKQVQENEVEAQRCRQLIRLKTDVEIGDNLRHFRLRQNEAK